ncbi:tRNA (guanosine(37)-N1)-methyltransferase TrmD [Candidatus Auribacterota bacterium]
MKIEVLTLFPGMFKGPMDESIIGKARQKSIFELEIHNIRDYAEGKHRVTDDRPYGGGPGMVMKPEPIYKAVKAIRRKKTKVLFMSPDGEPFDQKMARELSREKHLVLLCGHYEGIDERARSLADKEISIGDFVMTNGALASLVIIDTVVRLLPGAVGDERSIEEESFSGDSLDWPHYTRPPVYKGKEVPPVLLSGDHKKIAEWREKQASDKTIKRRSKKTKEISDKNIKERKGYKR